MSVFEDWRKFSIPQIIGERHFAKAMVSSGFGLSSSLIASPVKSPDRAW
jgi:hypothetical protein